MADQNSLIVKLLYSSSSAAAIKRVTQAALSKAPRPAASASTAKQASPSKITANFTKSQLALALAIHKAKPESLSTNEYCQQLRKSIKAGQSLSSDRLRYLDTCEFWKDLYTKIHLEKKVLQDKIYTLEEGRRLLLESLHDQINPSMFRSSSRLLLGDSEPNDRMRNEGSRKRPAPTEEHTAEDHAQGHLDTSLEEDNFLRMSSYVLRMGRQRTNLEKASKDSSTLSHINSLSKHTIEALMLLKNALAECCLPMRMLKTSCEDTRNLAIIEQFMLQVGLSFLSCFKALDELCRTILGRVKVPEIVYRMVMFFNKSLNLLHNLGKMQAEHEASEISRRVRHKRSRTEEQEYIVNKYLANSLACIVHGLEWKIAPIGHGDLLEGLLFCILEHSARLVSEAVFAEHVATSDNPGNITKNDNPVASRSVKHESRYIVQILQAALGGSKRKELIAHVLAAGKLNSDGQAHLGGSALSSTLSSDLLSRAKKLLQSTLVKSAIGENGLETLRLPTPPIEDLGQHVDVSNEVEKYGSEWLIECVWGIIGWDIVA